MIAVSPRNLDEDPKRRLKDLQDEVDGKANYEQQVQHAKARWKTKPANPFDDLKGLLASMCSGNRRCVYCEDSYADEIEHMRPKDLFPEQAFKWDNFVLACGPCNGPKNNKFSVLANPLALLDVTRKRKALVVPPAVGRHALIDPRGEDPVQFIWLDFRTWRYVPNSNDDKSEVWLRAEYTIDVLGLNKRDDLVRGRKAAFSGFEARLRSWIDNKEHWDEEEKKSFISDFKAERYRGVWERMKRHRNEIELLRGVATLIENAPESLGW